MASRFYLKSATADAPVPNAKQSADTIATGHDFASTYATYASPAKMTGGVGSNDRQVQASVAETGAAHYAHYGTWVSDPLAAQTISGTVTIALSMYESNVNCNLNPRVKIYRWLANDTFSSDILALTTSGTEAGTSYSLVTYFSAVNITETTFAAGDRIVIEIESYDNNTKTASYTHGIQFDGSTSAYQSYVEFSSNILLQNSSPIQKGLAYKVKTFPSAITKGLAYKVKSTPTYQRTLAYKVPKWYSYTRSLAYKVKTIPSTVQKALAYIVKLNPTIQKTLAFNIKLWPTYQRTLIYKVKTIPSAITKGLEYVVSTASSHTYQRTLAYDIKLIFTYQRTLNYKVKSAPEKTKSLVYRVPKAYSIQSAIAYKVKKLYSVTKNIIYTVPYLYTKQITENYKVKTVPSSKTLDLNYKAKKTYSSTKDTVYKILRLDTIQKDLTFRAFIFPTIQKNIVYKILITDTKQKGLVYKAFIISTIQKGLNYNIGKTYTVQKGLVYKVFIENTLLEDLDYNIVKTYTAQKGLVFRAFITPTINKNLVYKVPNIYPLSKDLDFSVSSTQTSQKTMVYRVFITQTIEKGLQYELPYDVEYHTIQKSLTYSVFTENITIYKKIGSGDWFTLITEPWSDGSFVDDGPFTYGVTYHYRARRVQMVDGVPVYLPESNEDDVIIYPKEIIEKDLVYTVILTYSIQNYLSYRVLTVPSTVQKGLTYVVTSLAAPWIDSIQVGETIEISWWLP